MEALEALFGQSPTPANDVALAVPSNLDATVEADMHTVWDGPLYRWYRGRDGAGVLRVFRFQRGASLVQWHELLAAQRLTSVEGPFRSQAHAAR